MTDYGIPTDPIREVSHDAATEAVPIDVTETPDFEAWSAVVDDIADDIERAVRAEVDA